MRVRKVDETTFTVTMTIGFLDLIFIKNINDEDQFVTIKNHTTRENLTHIFNKDGLYSSFPIKDEEVCDLIKLCNRFIYHCSYGTSVSADTTYDNMQKIYNAIEEKKDCIGKETVLYSSTISSEGTFTLADNVNNYDFIIINHIHSADNRYRSVVLSKTEISKCTSRANRFFCVNGLGDDSSFTSGYFNKNKVVKRTLDHSVPQMLVFAGEIKERHIRKSSQEKSEQLW